MDPGYKAECTSNTSETVLVSYQPSFSTVIQQLLLKTFTLIYIIQDPPALIRSNTTQ